MEKTAGFIGLGNMGLPMASNLLKNQVKLVVYNRSKEKAADLLKQGAAFSDTPKALFQKVPIVFSMVANDDALKEVTCGKNGLLENPTPGSIHVSMSTVSPALIKELHAAHEEKGIKFLSAPVFGRPEAAAAQKLWICVAGEQKAKEQAVPLLEFMGQKVYDFGMDPVFANTVKVSGNFLILSVIEALSEAYAFAKKNGVDLPTFNTLLGDFLFTSPIFKVYGQLLVSQKFEPAGFKMELGLKDINLLLKAADNLKVPMPIASLLHDRLMTGMANNRSHMDWSAIALSSFKDSGL